MAAADRDAGSVLLEIPPGDWERWARRQNRRMLGSAHLRDDSAGTLGSRTRCGLDVDTDHDYEPALVWRQLTLWAGSELSRREDVASWEEDAEATLSALYRRLCSTCAVPEIATFAPQRGERNDQRGEIAWKGWTNKSVPQLRGTDAPPFHQPLGDSMAIWCMA